MHISFKDNYNVVFAGTQNRTIRDLEISGQHRSIYILKARVSIYYRLLNVLGSYAINSIQYSFIRAFIAGAASQAGDADSSRAPGLTSGLQGSVNVHHGALLLMPQ